MRLRRRLLRDRTASRATRKTENCRLFSGQINPLLFTMGITDCAPQSGAVISPSRGVFFRINCTVERLSIASRNWWYLRTQNEMTNWPRPGRCQRAAARREFFLFYSSTVLDVLRSVIEGVIQKFRVFFFFLECGSVGKIRFSRSWC